MNKKKLLSLSIGVFMVIIIGWNLVPYVFTSSNIVSKMNSKYEYVQINIYNENNAKDKSIIKGEQSDKIQDFINSLNELKVRRTTRPNDVEDYEVYFIASYKGDDDINHTKQVFTIDFYKNNIIGIEDNSSHKEIFYKIQENEFNAKDFLNKYK